MNSSTPEPDGSGEAPSHSELIREASELKRESDCPWLASDPQLLAAAAADRLRLKTSDSLDLTPEEAATLAKMEHDVLRLVRRTAG